MDGDLHGCCDSGSDPSISEPHHDMEFETEESAYSFYRDYAWSIGFGVTIKVSRWSKMKFACSRYSSKRENDTIVNPWPASGRGATPGMHIKRREDVTWVVCDFAAEHIDNMCADEYYNNAVRARNRPPRQFPLSCQKIDTGAMECLAQMRAEIPNFFYADLCPKNSLRCVFWVDHVGLFVSYMLRETYARVWLYGG